ncbi:MAG: class B sortase [Oscillospiraceae bacterium]|nr:class B sortase [Oscillospiraceae bacterium]
MLKLMKILHKAFDVLVIVAFLVMMAIGAYFTYDSAYVYYHASADRVAMYRPGSKEAEEIRAAAADSEAVVYREFTSDYVAWITMDNTGVDYPIMQGEDNMKYLNLDPYGDYSLSGSIFLDSRNAGDFSDPYSIIYGHHMAGGYMFGALDKYLSAGYIGAHTDGTLYVGDEEYALKVFAVLQPDARESVIFDPMSGLDPVSYARNHSLWFVEPRDGRILALTTCQSGTGTGRTAVLVTVTAKDNAPNSY